MRNVFLTFLSLPILALSMQNTFAENQSFAPVNKTPVQKPTECSFITRFDYPASYNRIFDIAIDNNNHIYVIPNVNGLCKSVDGGLSWQYFDIEGFYPASVLAVDHKNNVYYGGKKDYGDYLYKSADGGYSWTNISAEFTNHIKTIAVGTLDQIVTAGIGVDISRNSGATWENLEKKTAEAVLVDLNNTIYLFGSFFYKSIDNGHSWVEIPRPEYVMFAKTALDNQNAIYLGDGDQLTPEGLFKSTDGGNNWENILNKKYAINDIAIDKNNNFIYVAVWNQFTEVESILKSPDGGHTWIPTTFPDKIIEHVAIDNKGHVYVGIFEKQDGASHFFKSIDGGLTWFGLNGNDPAFP